MYENSILERSHQRENPQLPSALARLKKGQTWLVETWREWWDVHPWPDDVLAPWQRSYDAWDELERATRHYWNLESCVIGDEGCHPDAPINCGYCSSRENRPSESIQVIQPSTEQASMFRISRPHD